MSYLVMPHTPGWVVHWIKGWRLPKEGKPQKPIYDSFYTTDKAKAEAKKEELIKGGFEDVTLYECIF